MNGNRKMAFEWTTQGFNIVDYDQRIIIDSKKLGEFTIGQVLQSSAICSHSKFDKTTNNCRKWTNDVMGQLKQYNNGMQAIDALVALLILDAIKKGRDTK